MELPEELSWPDTRRTVTHDHAVSRRVRRNDLPVAVIGPTLRPEEICALGEIGGFRVMTTRDLAAMSTTGVLTTAKFERVLRSLDSLLRAVADFEVIYVATSDHNFRAARAQFRKQFGAVCKRVQGTLGFDLRTVSRSPESSASRLHPRFTTLLLRFPYPSLQRNERHGSRQGSELTR